MTPQTQAHPDLDLEQNHIRRSRKALVAAAHNAAAAREGGGDQKAAAALAERAADLIASYDIPDEHICVGRIDRSDGRSVHVGKRMIQQDDELLVASWAAPVGIQFYEATEEDSQNLERRLRFELEGLVLRGIEEERFRTRPPSSQSDPTAPDERATTSEAPPRGTAPGAGSTPDGLQRVEVPSVETTDALLRELARGREPEMRDIVATITAGQYRLIREDREGVLVVQGGPGTGKTAVALHRAAWLLINHREDLEASGVLVVGPNGAFMEYVGRVLPMLGEHTVAQREIDHLGTARRNTTPDRRDVRRLKGDPRMVDVLRRAVASLVRPPGSVTRFTGPGFDVRLSPEDVREVIDRVRGRATGHVEGRRLFESALEQLVLERANVGQGTRAQAVATTLRRTSEWSNVLTRVWPRIPPQAFVHQLLGTASRLDAAADTVLDPGETDLIRRPSGVKIGAARWTADDLPLVDEAAYLMGELPQTYGYVIVDEAQDLSPMQLRMVARRSRGGITLVGDLAQATGAWRHTAWSEITEHVGPGPARIGELTVSYRTPKQAMEVAGPVQQAFAPSVVTPEAVRTGAADVAWHHVSADRLATSIAAEVVSLRGEEDGRRSIGVITGADLGRDVSAALEQHGVEFGSIERDGVSRDVTLLSAASAKGLEFDHVIVAEPATLIDPSDAADDPSWALPFLFVALTRSTQTLSILFSGDLPAPLSAPPGTVPVPSPAPAPAPDLEPAAVPPLTSATTSTLGARFTEALLWSKLLYERRPRRGRTVPYFAHLMATAAMVLDDGGTEDEAIAGLLHDVPEDFGYVEMLDDIGRRFGHSVREIVRQSGDPEPVDGEPWRDFKTRYIAQIENGGAAARRVALAEKLDNARNLVRDVHRVGDAAYQRLDVDAADMRWYLDALAALFAREHEGALAQEFVAVVDELPRPKNDHEAGDDA